MKKSILFTLCAVAAMSLSARDILWNGDNAEVLTADGWWDRCQPVVVDDNGNNVLKFTIYPDGQGVEGAQPWERNNIAKGFGGRDFTSKRVTVRIKKATPGNVRLVLEKINNGGDYTVAKWYDGNGEWRTLTFDFNGRFQSDNTVDVLQIYTHIEGGTGTEDVYMDDLTIEDLPQVKKLDNATVFTGSWAKGINCDITAGWKEYDYDDFATLDPEALDAPTFDMTQAVVLGNDWDLETTKLRECLETSKYNMIIYTNRTMGNLWNVVNGGIADNIYLFEGKPLLIPTAFTARNITFETSLGTSLKALVLPFNVSVVKSGDVDLTEDDYRTSVIYMIGGNGITTAYSEVTANEPFMIKGKKEFEKIVFCGAEQLIEATTTNDLGDGTFWANYSTRINPANVNYAPATIDGKDLFVKIAEEFQNEPFHAYIRSEAGYDNFVVDGVVPFSGDVNGDGVVDIQDVNLTINIILGSSEYSVAADMNGDGIIDIIDMNCIINIILGKI